ncbi:hypothetical protein EQ500_04575, partial [Lactobacillus sp. XV13L]|nr:hypothetical protein [Lactobacillus sp. XV13L]
MAAVKLEQYLTSILNSTKADTNEVRLRPGNRDLDLLAVALENHNVGVHRYQTSNALLLYAAQGRTHVAINGQDYLLVAGNIVLLQGKSSYEVQRQSPGDLLVKLELSAQVDLRQLFGGSMRLEGPEKQAVQEVEDALRTNRLLYLKCTPMSVSVQLLKKVINEYLNQNLFA